MIVGTCYYLLKEEDKINSNFTNLLRLNGAIGYMDKRYTEMVTGRVDAPLQGSADYSSSRQIEKDKIIWYVL